MKCEDYFVSYTLHLMRPLPSPRVMQLKSLQLGMEVGLWLMGAS